MSYEKEDRPSQSQWLIRPSTEGAESQDGEQYHSGNSTPARKPFQNPKTAILIVATVLLYAALLIAYVLKTPSDQECHRRLSVWCTSDSYHNHCPPSVLMVHFKHL